MATAAEIPGADDVSLQSKKDENILSENEDLSKFGIYYHDDYDYLKHLKSVGQDPSAVILSAHGQKESPEKGIHFKDENDANEMDHVTGKSKKNVSLPSDVFPSGQEMDVGLMNQPGTLGMM